MLGSLNIVAVNTLDSHRVEQGAQLTEQTCHSTGLFSRLCCRWLYRRKEYCRGEYP